MRVFGIDPGTFKMGVGVVDSERGELVLIYAGVLSPPRRDSLPERLHYIYEELLSLMKQWKPSEVAIEEPFVARNIRAAMAVGQAQGVALTAAAHYGLEAFGYSPRAVKRSVTDYGGSSKGQVQEMVGAILGLDDWAGQSTDTTDALAVAICHISATQISQLAVRE